MGLRAVYRLRWRMEYRNGLPRYSQWMRSSQRPEQMAAFSKRDGLTWAVIEGEHVITREVARIVEVPGHLFEAFQWIEAVRVPGGGLGIKGSVSVPGLCVGLVVVTPDDRYEVHCDGQVYHRLKTPEEKKTLLANV